MYYRCYNWLSGSKLSLLPTSDYAHAAQRIYAQARCRSQQKGMSEDTALQLIFMERRMGQTASFFIQMGLLLSLLGVVYTQKKVGLDAFTLIALLACVQWLPFLILRAWRPAFSITPPKT